MLSSPYLRYKTYADKTWSYDEYYRGEKDDEKRKKGHGENHWVGAKSIEWYTGSFLRDTMHGLGDYRWRYAGYDGLHTTYEGYFYSNDIHGYGTMSYPDGIVFTGLYSNNIRYGPGVETNFTHEDVGLWRGMRLMRLAWRPSCSSLIPDLALGELGKKYVEPQRVLMTSNSVVIGEINSALDLLKQNGCDPKRAIEKWRKCYPKHCTDQASKLCEVKDFQSNYYINNIQELVVIDALPVAADNNRGNSPILNPSTDNTFYFTWNNDDLLIDIMKHCFKHEEQRIGQEMPVIDLRSILSGQRKAFKYPGKYEVDSRTLLMSSFLGEVATVAEQVNDNDVYPGVTDSKGNSAIMYATFGDQTDIIHFLVEAGANVDSYNDSCCTPLGMAILRFLFTEKDVTPSEMIQALTPPPVLPPQPPSATAMDQINEWNISREVIHQTAGLARAPSKLLKGNKKSAQSLKDAPKKKGDNQPKLPEIPETVSAESISENKKTYNRVCLQYVSAINDLFVLPSITNAVTYIFDINDMTIGLDTEEDPKKSSDKNAKKITSKIIKQPTRPSKEAMWRSSEKDISSLDIGEKLKTDNLSKITFTILQLLADGANPNLVKCPYPALLMAVFAGCPDLVLHLVLHGANVNEKYPQMFDYTPLDIAMSQTLTFNNLDLIRTLLECGSCTNHRLLFKEQDDKIPGPTLLHVLLAKKMDSEEEIEIQKNILELLLQYKCDPIVQFKGRSAIDIALSKGANVVDIFIESPNTNLNAIINDSNQSILVKIFSLTFFKTADPAERLQMITNLLLFGADPLIECKNNQEIYQNIFVFMKKTCFDLENTYGSKPSNPTGSGKSDAKDKQGKEKAKVPEKQPTKSTLKIGADDVGDYKQARELMTDCARMLYIRWLQAKLMKELVRIIDRFQHRQWNMILKEHKDKKRVGLWLTPERCLEIWDIYKTTRNKIYKNNRVLKHLLCMVIFYNKKYKDHVKETSPTAEIKNGIESDVASILRDYTTGTKLENDVSVKRPYVKPELMSKAEKFNVCFECILPNEEMTIKCKSCKLIVFCSMECMKVNIDRPFCHPCSEYLRNTYFPPSSTNYSDDREPMIK